MNKQLSSLLIALAIGTGAQAQLKVGSPAGAPSSTLQVAGSQSGTYKLISADRTLDATDYYTAYNTPAAGGTITLPVYTAVSPATGTIGGRVYHIKNTGTGILTVNAATGEQIDNQGTTGVTSISLAPGYYAMLISKGTTSGTTWEVALTGNAAGCIPAYMMASLSGDQAVPNGTTNTNVNYATTMSSGGTGITLLPNGFFRLQPGNTYRLEALPRARAFANATDGNARFQWYVSGGGYIGNLAVSLPTTYSTSNESASPTAVALITPTVVTDVAVAISYANAGAFSLQASTSYAVVNQLNACGSGTGTSTSVTASNGLSAASNNVTLGGTLTQNTDVATAGFNQTFSGTGKVGVGTTTPGSTLQSAGSFSASYRAITTSGTTALTGSDFYTAYAASNSAAATFTLPQATTSPSLIGRVYYIKNDNATYAVTVNPFNASETINGATSVLVPAGQTVQLVSTGATSGSTWEVVAFASSTPVATGSSSTYYATGTTQVSIPTSGNTDIPGATVTFTTTNASSKVLVTGTGYFVPATSSGTQGSMNIVVDGTVVSSGYWVGGSVNNGGGTIGNIPFPVTIQYALTVAAGTHTIKLSARGWNAAATANIDAVASGYVGATSVDANAIKCRVSALVVAQ